MENLTIQNKETIQILYDSILNQQKFEKLETLIAKDYTNAQGAKGVEAFKRSILELSRSFPDARWNIEEIIAEGNKVFVKQKFTGTQKEAFQGIAPTHNSVSVAGMAIYEFLDGKIIHSQVQTDRLGFLQQLNVLPVDLSKLTKPGANTNTAE